MRSRIWQFIKQNLGLVFLIFLLFVGVLSVSVSGNQLQFLILESLSEAPIKVAVESALGAVLALLTYRFFRFYLNPHDDDRQPPDISPDALLTSQADKYLLELSSRTNEVLAHIEKRIADAIGGRQAPELFDSVEEKSAFKRALTRDIVKEATANIDKEVVSRLSSRPKFEDAEKYQRQIRERLYEVVLGLERRANLNLSVGATIGGSGIALLIYLLYAAGHCRFTGPCSLDDTILFTHQHCVPRRGFRLFLS
jgi:hypothetical protein